MLSIELFLYFVISSTLLIVIPGPNVLVIIGTSLTQGRARGLQTVAGTTTAMALQLMIAASATAGLMVLLAQGFVLIKWLGVIYLLYLALKHFRLALQRQPEEEVLTGGGSFTRGFFVSLTNPKTIVFFAAFLPQFISPSHPVWPQLLILSLTFLCLAAILDSCYALLAAKAKPYLLKNRLTNLSHAISSGVYLLACGWLYRASR